jgi:type II restriction/modification system DNA methylase subunit YeeA
MTQTMSANDFIAKWQGATLKERSAYQSHFNDLCALVGHPTPTELDPAGSFFTFERGAVKSTGSDGWADVWYKGHFALEYKGLHANLDKAYQQLLAYRESLENPPLMILCDLDKIIIRTNFTNTKTSTFTICLEDIKAPDNLAVLRNAFYNPDNLRQGTTPEIVTEAAAAKFSELADKLLKRGYIPEDIAKFLIRLLFVLFAEDTGILPNNLLYDLATSARLRPQAFASALKSLFGAMATGGWFGKDEIRQIDGHLFSDDTVIPLESDEIQILQQVSRLDWAGLSPAILGTLFERSLNPAKRSQLGAHYTSSADIMLIIEPVLMRPLREKWKTIQEQAKYLSSQAAGVKSLKDRQTIQRKISDLLTGFAKDISSVQVLDPACGSGNFLYMALRNLLDLEGEVVNFAGDIGVGRFFPNVSPSQLHGIEINEYAHQLAQATIQIGYLQWLSANGFGLPADPILSPLDGIQHMDAIIQHGVDGEISEPAWTEADVIIGNPPFLGDKKMKAELGDQYVNDLRNLYAGRIAGGADLVTYWFEKSRQMIADKKVKRVGLLSTNSIRTGSNRKVLDRINETGGIFMAWDDRSWILDGADVRVSMVGFDDGTDKEKLLNGVNVSSINSDLTSHVDITQVQPLEENSGICFVGVMKGAPFDIDGKIARQMLAVTNNPNGRPNSDVVKRLMTGRDVANRPSDTWIIDFVNMPETEACLYAAPFEYVQNVVKPIRDKNKEKGLRERWWIHSRFSPDLRKAITGLKRCIVTPEVSKWRIFIWIDTEIVPDHKLHVFARDDDYFFGVLHSRIHEVWSLAMCSWMGVGNDPSYSSSRTFKTFPLPWTPGNEPIDHPLYSAVSVAAKNLNEKRDNVINGVGATKGDTLTKLYNLKPNWLLNLHKELDQAVFAAYGWSPAMSDNEILENLYKLNLQRAAESKMFS